MPRRIIAHILDPNRDDHYRTEKWSIDKDVSKDTVERFAEGNNIYVVQAYENGAPKQTVVEKAVWIHQKGGLDAAEAEEWEANLTRELGEDQLNKK